LVSQYVVGDDHLTNLRLLAVARRDSHEEHHGGMMSEIQLGSTNRRARVASTSDRPECERVRTLRGLRFNLAKHECWTGLRLRRSGIEVDAESLQRGHELS